MEKVTWLIEKDLFPEYDTKLAEAVIKSGHSVIFVEYENNFSELERYLNKKTSNNDSDIYIFHGSLQFGAKFEKLEYYPAIYLSLPNYECYNYYGYFGDKLLNSNYIMMGLNDVMRNIKMLISHFNVYKNNANKIFIRPSNGFKSFTGQCLSINNFDYEFDLLTKSYGGLDMNTLVLLSDTKNIKKEYRFIIVDGEVVSGAIYKDENNKNSLEPYYDKIATVQNAFEYVKSVKDIYHPDRAFNIDICELENGEFKVIEINSFTCGSLYGNDLDKVVSAINKLAIDDYNDVYL